MKEFMSLLPLTLEIAAYPVPNWQTLHRRPNEVRRNMVRNAFKWPANW